MPNNRNVDVLIFVEDPGAANFVAPLVPALADHGVHTVVLAVSIARDYLLKRGVSIQEVYPSESHQILNTIKPRVLLVGTAENVDTLGLALVAEARSRGIPSIGAIDAVVNAERRFRGRSNRPLLYAPDWLMVPDEWTKQTFISLGFSDAQVIICGHPHYDFVMRISKQLAEEGCCKVRQRLFPKITIDKKIVVFICEGSARIEPRSRKELDTYSFIGRGLGVGRTEIILEEFLDAIAGVKPRPHVVLRIHPKDEVGEYVIYKNELDQISSDEFSLELIYAADLIVGMTSMLMLEAVLMGKPTLSILPRSIEKEWLPSIRAGLTPCVMARNDLGIVIKELLQNKKVPKRNENTNFITSDSLKRSIAFLKQLLMSY